MQGCGKGKAESPFNLIQPGKTLLHYSEFELIDDFNSGFAKNKQGREWKIVKDSKPQTALAANTEDSLNPFGGSVKIICRDGQVADCEIQNHFGHLDMSQAKYLVGRIKDNNRHLFNGSIYFGLTDAYGRQSEVKLNRMYLHADQERPGGWSSIQIPLNEFKGLQFDYLSDFNIKIESERTDPQELIFDDFAFFGPKNVYVLSSGDNLKKFPPAPVRHNRAERLKKETNDERFLKQIAKDTWQFFDDAVDKKTELVVDHVRLGRTKGIGDYTSPTNIAFYWLACVAAYDLDFISKKDALGRIERSLKIVDKLERWDGKYFYNYYHTATLQVTRHYVSSVDLAWLAASLAVLRQAFPGAFDQTIDRLLKQIDFSIFYDESIGHLRLGFDEDQATFSPYHYGLLISEARLMSYVAIAKGDLPKTHWARINRTLPAEWNWQTQTPQGREKELFGISYFGGYYTYKGQKLLPSWGGSLFEVLSPALLLNSKELSPDSFWLNNQRTVEAHIDYALNEKKYPVWGLAPAAIPNGKQWLYREYGLKAVAAKGYMEEGVIAPYASILALEVKPDAVIKNLRAMLEKFPDIYGPYGFYDAVDVTRNRVTEQYLALDEGMILVALTNHLKNGSIRNRFRRDPIGKNGEMLLTEEHFFN